MNSREREIRRVLMGLTRTEEDGRLCAAEPGFHPEFLGFREGGDVVRIFGMMSRTIRYETKAGAAKTLNAARESMSRIGLAVSLREQPETAACLCRFLLTRPALLVFALEEDGSPVLTAWTGRGLTGPLSLWRAARAFDEELPESVRRMDRDHAKGTVPKRKKRGKKTPGKDGKPDGQ